MDTHAGSWYVKNGKKNIVDYNNMYRMCIK